VYTAAHLSLAVLEVLVHVSAEEDLPADLVSVAADLPEDLGVEHVRLADLPGQWRLTPAPSKLADLGTVWLRGMTTAALAVPSAVIPSETNYILNPVHPDFRRIVVHRTEAFDLDWRLGRAGPAHPVRLIDGGAPRRVRRRIDG
jgi:RES domain-containing protein